MNNEAADRLAKYRSEKSRSVQPQKKLEDSQLNSTAESWMTCKQAGDYLGYSDWSIRSFANRKLIRHAKLPGASGGYRFRREWLDEFMQARTIEPKQAMAIPQKPTLKTVATSSIKDPELHAAIERARKRMEKQKEKSR